jgi:hypothetical protein
MQTSAQADVNEAQDQSLLDELDALPPCGGLFRSESELNVTTTTPADCDLNQTFICAKAKEEEEPIISDSFGDSCLCLPMNSFELSASVSTAFERQLSDEESPPKKQKIATHSEVVFVCADNKYNLGFNPRSNPGLVRALLGAYQGADSVTVSAAMDTFVNTLLVGLSNQTNHDPEIDRVSSPFNDSPPIKALKTTKRNVKSTPAVRNAFVKEVLEPLAAAGLLNKLEFLSLNYPYEGKYSDYFKENQEEIQRSLLPDHLELFNFMTLAHAEFTAITAEFREAFNKNQAPANIMSKIVEKCTAARARIAFALNPLSPPEFVEDLINRICNLSPALLKTVPEKVANVCKAACKWLQKRDGFPPMLFDAIVVFTFSYLKWLRSQELITQGEFQTFINHTEAGMSEAVFLSLLDNQLTRERLMEFAHTTAPFHIDDSEVDDFYATQLQQTQVQVTLINKIFDTPELRNALLSFAQKVDHVRVFVFTTTLNAENQIATFPRGESQNPLHAHRAKILREEIKKRDLQREMTGEEYQMIVEEAHAAAALRF